MPARTATVTNICALPGSPLKAITKGPVSAKLNTISFTIDGTTEKARSRYADVDPVTGSWSMVLEINDDLDPTGTSWVIREPTGATWTIQLAAANAGQTVNLRDVLVADPTNPNPIVAGATVAALAAETSARTAGDAATLASAATDATTKANSAQAAATVAAATDATTKAGAAQAAAQGSSLQKTANLGDLASPSAARTALGLGSMAVAQTSGYQTRGSLFIDPSDPAYGAVGDGRQLAITTTSGSPTLTATRGTTFLPSDTGKQIIVRGAGASGPAGTHLVGTVTYIDSATATCSANATATLTDAPAFVGTDNATAITAAAAAWMALLNSGYSADLVFPRGTFLTSAAITCTPSRGPVITGGAVRGWGSNVVLTAAATNLFTFVTRGSGVGWHRLDLLGVQCYFGSVQLRAGGNSEFIWNNHVEGLGVYWGVCPLRLSGVFESNVLDCNFEVDPTVTPTLDTQSALLIEKESGGAQPSSIGIQNVTTRGGFRGIRSPNGADVRVYNVTVLAAQHEGVYLQGNGCVIDGVHAEDNWLAGTAGDNPAVRLTGSGTIARVFAYADTNASQAPYTGTTSQKNGSQVFVSFSDVTGATAAGNVNVSDVQVISNVAGANALRVNGGQTGSTLTLGGGVPTINASGSFGQVQIINPASIGSSTKITATNATWPIPVGATLLRITAVGGGGQGGGAGSAAAAQLQTGGAGGAAGTASTQVVSVGANTTLNVTIGAGGSAAGVGGAAGGNAGTTGTVGGDTTVTATGISVTGKGGTSGAGSAASSTATVNGGLYGSNFVRATVVTAGSGGQSNIAGGHPVGDSPGGGSGGGTATTTLGGGAGGTGSAISAGLAPGGNSGTSAGFDGAAATDLGAGGGGGGGGAAGTGKGGNGGAGAAGFVLIQVVG